MTALSEGNRLYLVCSAHLDDPFELGRRQQAGWSAAWLMRAQDLGDWFDEHANCPDSPDCFKLAYAKPQNHDVDPVVDPTKNIGAAVRMALAK